MIVLAALVTGSVAQQQRRTGSRARTTTTAKKKATAKKASTARKTNRPKARTTRRKGKAGASVSIKGLQNEQAQIKRNIRQQEQKLRSNERDVKKRLQNLMIINTEIEDKRKTIDTIRRDISTLDGNIVQLDRQLKELQAQLDDRKQKFVKSMRYMHRNRSIQNQMMFIFSAKNFSQMYRRMRFMREYAAYQRAQGEMVKSTQAEVTAKRDQLDETKQHKSNLLSRGERERANLENKQTEQQKVVSTLQKQQKTIQQIIEQQRKRDAELNAKIDRLIAEEVERARARAAEKARRDAERKAEAARKRAEEMARKKAEAEAAARENARRIAEAKEKEQRLKAEAQAAARKSAAEKAAADKAARAAEKARRDAERKAEADAREHAKEMAEARKSDELIYKMDSEDRRISGSFESNRGRLPMPVTGGYRIVSHFGQYNVEGLKGVRLDNKGINIQGQPGAQARSIFDGEVSAVFNYGGTTGVMVRHGSYISVYCNLSSVSVHRGQKVSTRQVLGTIGQDNILQFQLRREKGKLNPEAWLGR